MFLQSYQIVFGLCFDSFYFKKSNRRKVISSSHFLSSSNLFNLGISKLILLKWRTTKTSLPSPTNQTKEYSLKLNFLLFLSAGMHLLFEKYHDYYCCCRYHHVLHSFHQSKQEHIKTLFNLKFQDILTVQKGILQRVITDSAIKCGLAVPALLLIQLGALILELKPDLPSSQL